MRSQRFSYSRPEQADFRSALMRASQPQKSGLHDQSAKSSAERSFEEYDPYHNRNISSIVSKITDEGPANVHPIKRKPLRKNVANRSTVDNPQLAEDTYSPSKPPQTAPEQVAAQPFTFNEAEFGEETKASGQIKHPILYQSALLSLAAVVAVIGFLLYQLTLKADEFSQALHLEEEQLILAKGAQESLPEMLPQLNSLGETLSELKAELHGIKVGQQTYQNQETNRPEKMLQWTMPVSVKGDELGVLKHDLKRILNSRHVPELRRVTVQGQQQQSTSMGEIKTVQDEHVPNKLVVNLVSLTSREKAQAAHDLLIQAGVSPLIEEAVVNGKQIYRLSVDGFDSRESAQEFIAQVSDKYGFEGGWIRQQ
jgi:hypothetical protein